eukprot:s3056_g4.t1
MALSSLAKDAAGHLENLETKMSAVMRKSLSQELLRLGTAQARAADEQIQEMITLDALLNDMVSKSSKLFGGDFAAAMARVTSFNRWAIIEHDLSTSTEVLRPPDDMQRLEERAHFARLMETHLEMYILVLSQMHRSLGDRASQQIEASLTRKAQRMARLLLPDLILHSSQSDSASRQLQIFGSSPLLSPVGGSRCSSLTEPSPREALCCRLLSRQEFYLEFLVTCLWLPLMDPPEDPINGLDFAHPVRVDGFSTENACFLAPDASMRQPDQLADLVQDGLAACADNQVLQSLQQEWTQRTFFADQEQIHYMCGDPTERHIKLLPFTFDTDGLCLERVRLFQNDVVAVLTSAHFESRLEHQLSEIKRSTCRLAYRTSGLPYSAPKWNQTKPAMAQRHTNGQEVIKFKDFVFQTVLASAGDQSRGDQVERLRVSNSFRAMQNRLQQENPTLHRNILRFLGLGLPGGATNAGQQGLIVGVHVRAWSGCTSLRCEKVAHRQPYETPRPFTGSWSTSSSSWTGDHCSPCPMRHSFVNPNRDASIALQHMRPTPNRHEIDQPQ